MKRYLLDATRKPSILQSMHMLGIYILCRAHLLQEKHLNKIEFIRGGNDHYSYYIALNPRLFLNKFKQLPSEEQLKYIKNLNSRNYSPTYTNILFGHYTFLKNNVVEVIKCFNQLDNNNLTTGRIDEVNGLMLAAETGNMQLVKLLSDKIEGNLLLKDKTNYDARHYAAAFGQLPILKYFFDNYPMYITDKNDSSLIKKAIDNDEVKTFKFLCQYYQKLDELDSTGETVIHYICAHTHSKKCLNAIFKMKDIDYNVHDKYGNTPIFYAVQSNAKEVIERLYYQGAALDLCNNDKNDVTQFAVLHGKPSMVDFLLKRFEYKIDWHRVNKDGKSLEDLLKEKNDNENLETLQELHNKDKTRYDEKNRHPIMQALLPPIPNWDYIRDQLEKKDFAINAQDDDGNTILHHCINTRNLHYIQTFVDEGSDLTIMNNKGHTVLINAILQRHTDIMRYLLKECPQLLNIQSDNGSALHEAVRNNFFEIVEILVKEYEIDLSTKDSLGRTALMLAEYKLPLLIEEYNTHLNDENIIGDMAEMLKSNKRIINYLTDRENSKNV